MTTTETPATQKSIYQRLGSAEGIAAIVDDVVAAHLENPVIRARFLPYLDSPEKVKLIKKHFCDFLGMGCGGPEQYSGRDMITAHRGMNINEMEFVAALDDILMVLDKHNIDPETKKDILAMSYSLKGEILHV
jgi:hemoglobin